MKYIISLFGCLAALLNIHPVIAVEESNIWIRKKIVDQEKDTIVIERHCMNG